jgi:hypothetical protein
MYVYPSQNHLRYPTVTMHNVYLFPLPDETEFCLIFEGQNIWDRCVSSELINVTVCMHVQHCVTLRKYHYEICKTPGFIFQIQISEVNNV